MKKYFLLLVTLLGLLTTACDNSFEEPKKETPTGSPIAMIEEQMSSIKASLPKLQNTANEAKALVAEPMSETRGDGNNGVKTMIEALEERIKALEEYVAGGGEGDWMDTTYATLDMYEETIALLAELQAEIESFKAENEAQYKDIMESIEKSVDSMKSWVNELFTGYYDIATIDAMFAKILEDLTAEDAAIRSEIETLRKELDKQFDDMEDAYRDAIREAIEENNGKLSEQLTKEIEAVNSRIDDEVEKLNKRLDDIEERLSQLEDSVSDLLKRIQSITYIPLYDDNTARVLCPNEGMEGSTVQLDFTISPRDAAEDLAAVWQEAVSVKALYTGSPVMTYLPVVSCTAYADQGLLSVVAACDNLSWEFYNEEVKARAIMYISDGNNDLTSEYIPMIPQRSQIPNNQIWYTVTGKTPVDIQQGSGPKIVSNTFDPSNEVYVVTFEEDIYSIPADYFAGKSELKIVVLPNSTSSLDDYAFSGCHNLSDISLGMSLGYIGSRVFEGCAIRTLSLPASLYGVNSEAFAGSSIAQFTGDVVADDGISLILNNALVAIAPAGIGTEYSVPAEVTTIGDGVFRDFYGIEHITIHDKVSSIGSEAFKNCGSLTSIVIPDSVKSIGSGAFGGCNNLHTITIGAGLTEIVSGLFSNLNNLKNITIGSGVTKIGDNAFKNCGSLTSIAIPDSVESIGSGAFTGCDSIEQFSGKFATEDGYALASNGTLMVFAKACGIDEYTIPADITYIEERVFANCSNISLFRFESTTPPTLGEGVFEGVDNLQISIPIEAVEAYLTCDWPYDYRRAIIELADINNIPDSCRIYYTTNDNQKLGVYPEDGYTVLSHNYTDGVGMVVFFKPLTTIGYGAFWNCESLTSVTIPDSVTSIGEEAFYSCNSLTNVTIPNSVTTIGDEAFWRCGGLTSVTIGDSVTTIGNSAFENCESLTSVTIPDSVTSIGNSTFAYCSSLTSVTIGDSVTSIGDGAFAECYSLTSVTIPDSVTSIGDSTFSGCSSLTSITIPEGVTSIGKHAFSGCSSLTSITIPEGVTSIGEHTFNSCSNLTSVNIPDSVTTIGSSAFCECTSLTSVTIPDSVTTIGDCAFYNCYRLTSVTIGDSVTTIGINAFFGCSSLTSVTIPDGVVSIGDDAFCSCSSLTSVNIPDGVTTIRGGTFSGCSSLTSITIPEGVTSIGGYAFYVCSSLTSITIPEGVTSIEECVFICCRSLENVYCKAIIPPAAERFTGDWLTFDFNASGRKIYVPMESVEAYKSADGWADYADSIVGYNFE